MEDDRNFVPRKSDYGRSRKFIRGDRFSRRESMDYYRDNEGYPRSTRNYRANHLYPREERGYRDQRNYARNIIPRERRNFDERRPNYHGERRDRRDREPIPPKEEMDMMLAEYMAKEE